MAYSRPSARQSGQGETGEPGFTRWPALAGGAGSRPRQIFRGFFLTPGLAYAPISSLMLESSACGAADAPFVLPKTLTLRGAFMKNRAILSLAAAVLLFGGGAKAQAAFLRFDDTLDSGITINANDFEGGLSINGAPFQIGLGVPATGTFPETGMPITFDGSWVAAGGVTPGTFTTYFAEASDPTLVSDILHYTVENNPASGLAHISGSFQSDVSDDLGLVPAGIVPFIETGKDLDASQQNLTFLVASDVDAATPEPATISLLGVGVASLLGHAWRRRKMAAAK
jgi:hypothetical protein